MSLASRQIGRIGQPSLHAVLLSHAQIKDGEHVVPVGAGTGCYTAIIAHLVGPSVKVTAIEVDPELARQAHANLSLRQNARVLQANGGDADFGTADVIYVSAGVTHPVKAWLWLDGLLEAGHLILPLTTDASVRAKGGACDYAKMARRGAVFKIERLGTDFSAQGICPAAYILAEGVRDKVSERALAFAFEKGDGKKVTRLYRSDNLPEDRFVGCAVLVGVWLMSDQIQGSVRGRIDILSYRGSWPMLSADHLPTVPSRAKQ